MKPILVLFTGGTIGSTADEAGRLAPRTPLAHPLFEAYQAQCRRRGMEPAPLEGRTVLETLSEDMTIAKWNTLLAALRGVDPAAYAGVIVTHGTDTLAYTANLLALLLSGWPLPVLLASADYVLADPRSNGIANFCDAAAFITETGLPGVFVPYRDAAGRRTVYRGDRLLQCDPLSDAFASADGAPFGEMTDGGFRQTGAAPAPRADVPLLDRLDRLYDCVLAVQPYVGLRYDRIALDNGVRAVLHGVYHAGTACTDGGRESPYAALSLIYRCRLRGVPVFLAPVKAGDRPVYASADRLAAAGAHSLPGLSFEMAYVRLLVAFSLYATTEEALAFALRG